MLYDHIFGFLVYTTLNTVNWQLYIFSLVRLICVGDDFGRV